MSNAMNFHNKCEQSLPEHNTIYKYSYIYLALELLRSYSMLFILCYLALFYSMLFSYTYHEISKTT